MFSSHSHSGQFCSHGQGSLRDCVLAAIRKQFVFFGLTEHMPRYRQQDLYPEEIECNQSYKDTIRIYDEFYTLAVELKKEFQNEIELVIGMEIEWIYESSICQLMELLKTYPVTYVVGSIHHINGIPIDYDRETFDKALASVGSLEQLFGKYYDEQYEMIRLVKPKVVGHFDLIRMYFTDVKYCDDVWKKVVRNIDLISSLDLLVEINSRGLKKDLKSPYPCKNVLKIMVEKNVRFTLSDDSHGPDDVAFRYNELKTYCQEMCIESVYDPLDRKYQI